MIYVRDDSDIFRARPRGYALRIWSFFATIFMISVVVLYLGSVVTSRIGVGERAELGLLCVSHVGAELYETR